MILATVLVPLARNDGSPQPRSLFTRLEALLFDRFDGWTDGGRKGGGWRSGDRTIYRDQSRQYEVALDSWRSVPAFLEVVEFVALHFKQLAVFYTIAGVPDIMPGPAPQENRPSDPSPS
jgi:hypothetical protein